MEKDIRELIKKLKVSYHSGHGDKLHQDFYSPLLANCKQYKRETGDFTSNVILDWGEALLNVIDKPEGECVIKIIAAPNLREEDKLLLTEVMNKQKDESYIDQITDNIFHEAFEFSKGNPENEIKLKIFAYLIVKKILILKFGFPKHVPSPGVFHSKAGIFYFNDELKVGFSGGANETHGGYVGNIERIDVFRNLDHEDLHINDIEEKFELGWKGHAPGFITKKLNKKILDKISSYAPVSKKELKKEITKFNKENNKNLGESISEEDRKKLESLIKPTTTNTDMDEILEEKENYLEVTEPKWEFQKEAREKFINAECGILEMATGTGKTRTALSIVTQLIKDKKINNIIIQLEKDNLIDQWEKNIREWLKSETYEDINLLKFAQNKNQLYEFLLSFQTNIVQLLIVSKHNLPELLKKINKLDSSKTIIIHDEVHGLFSDKILPEINGMQKNIKYKLGLSATVENEFNPDRAKILYNEIGSKVHEYPLKKAIEDGVLVEFDLIRLDYKLLESDIKKRTKAFAAYESDIKNGVNPVVAEKRRNLKLSAIKKNCVDKVRVFQNNFDKISKYLHRSFIYANEKVYVDRVLNVLVHKNINFKKHTDNANYENIDKFSRGEIDCLLNCEKLSEGIDVKSVNNIVLFATPQGIQLIQRLGRVLRTDSNFPNKRACVIDFFEEDDMNNKKGSDYNRFKKLNEYSEYKRLK